MVYNCNFTWVYGRKKTYSSCFFFSTSLHIAGGGHNLSMKSPFSHGFPMVLPTKSQFSYWFPMFSPFSYGFPMVFPMKSPFSMGKTPWFSPLIRRFVSLRQAAQARLGGPEALSSSGEVVPCVDGKPATPRQFRAFGGMENRTWRIIPLSGHGE